MSINPKKKPDYSTYTNKLQDWVILCTIDMQKPELSQLKIEISLNKLSCIMSKASLRPLEINSADEWRSQ